MRIWHVITGLGTGGAEMSLLRLVTSHRARGVESVVVSLTDEGPVGRLLAAGGTRVVALGMRRGVPDLGGLRRLRALIAAERPDVVQTWMYHANLAGGLAARLAGVRAVAWNIRAAHMEPGRERRSTIVLARALARAARALSRRVVTNSQAARDVHAGFGYPSALLTVIPNGFDVDAFRPDAAARAAVRAEIGIPRDAAVVGAVGRFHPAKDYATFFEAASRVSARHPAAHFVLAGDDVTPDTPALAALAAKPGLDGRVHLLGRRADTPRLFAALDVFVLTSRYESFPNVLGEAMAAGVPAVTTDVGEASAIVGDSGHVVPVADAPAIADAVTALLDLPTPERARLGARARARIVERYSLDSVAARYLEMYSELARVS